LKSRRPKIIIKKRERRRERRIKAKWSGRFRRQSLIGSSPKFE